MRTLRISDIYKLNDLLWVYTNSALQAIFPIYFYVVISSSFPLQVVGSVAAAEAVSLLILTISLYSFEITGLEAISKCKDKLDQKRTVFDILIVRSSILMLLVFVCVAAGMLSGQMFLYLILCWMPLVLSVILQSNYYFLATKQNFILFKTLSCAKGAAILLLALQHTSILKLQKVEMVIVAVGLLHLLPTLILAARVIGIGVIFEYRPNIRVLRRITLDQRNIFFANVGVALLKDANPMMMYFLGIRAEGLVFYTFAEKLVRAVQGGLRPLNKYLAARLIRRNIQTNLGSYKFPIFISCVSSVALFLALVASLPFIKEFLPDDSVGVIGVYISIMGGSTLLGVLNFYLGSIFLNLNDMAGIWRNAIGLSASITLLSGIPLIHSLGGIGAAITYLLAEVILFFCVVVIVRGLSK